MDVITVVMLAIVIIAVLKSFTLTPNFTCKCHCTPILSVAALLVDHQYSIMKAGDLIRFVSILP